MEQINLDKQMLGVKEVMAITGLGRAKAYELLKSGEFHVLKSGKKNLVHKEVLERYLKGEKARKSRW
ncbi:helix-turn-helix domain-containing protein [Neobacillus vireti]|uniref:helix-turn-helix domain-containing protein n=1 Tax=Neobacillus vireti TaxID=220686 RepID=UPI002FFD8832